MASVSHDFPGTGRSLLVSELDTPAPLCCVKVLREVRRFVSQEESRAHTSAARAVAWIVKSAMIKRETPAADAAVEAIPRDLNLSDLFIKNGSHTIADDLPVCSGGRAPVWQRSQFTLYLAECQAEPLCNDYE